MRQDATIPYRFGPGFASGAVLVGLGLHELIGWTTKTRTVWQRIPVVSEFIFNTAPRSIGLNGGWVALFLALALLIGGSLLLRRGVLSPVRLAGPAWPRFACIAAGVLIAVSAMMVCSGLEVSTGAGLDRRLAVGSIFLLIVSVWLYAWLAANNSPSLFDSIDLGEGADAWFAWRLAANLHFSPKLEFEAREAMAQTPPPVIGHVQASSPELLYQFAQLERSKLEGPAVYTSAYGRFVWELIESLGALRAEWQAGIFDLCREFMESTLRGVQVVEFTEDSLHHLQRRTVAVRPIVLFQLSKQAREVLSAPRPVPVTEEQAAAEAWISRINTVVRPLINGIKAPGPDLLDKMKLELQELDMQIRGPRFADPWAVERVEVGAGVYPGESAPADPERSELEGGFFQQE